MRKLLCLFGVVVFVVGFSACDPGTIIPVDPSPPTPDPIVLVHGWNSSPSAWDAFTQRLAADSFPADRIANFDYDDSQSNVTTAHELEAFIDATLARTGAAKVDVVTHSMGSLSIRWIMKHDTSYWPKVDAIATLAGTNHGTNLAWLWFSASANDMKPGSDFLDDLNAGDETPGPARWAAWWSDCDEVILPNSSALLDGAVNIDAGCLEHSDMHDDAAVYAGVREFIDG